MSLETANPIAARVFDAAARPNEATDHVDVRNPAAVGLWWMSACALAAALAIPFFLVDVPPVLDYPNHLARYFVLAHPDDPVLSQMYAPHWAILPNLGLDVLGMVLLKSIDVHVAGRLLLALSLFAPIAGAMLYSRAAFGRFTWWSLASGLAAFNGIFIMGFMNLLLSLGLALGAAAGWIVLRRRYGLLMAATIGSVSVGLVFFCHIFGVVLFGLLVGSSELARLEAHWRAGILTASEVVRTGVAICIAMAPALVLYLMSPLSSGGTFGTWGGLYKLWDLLTPFMVYSKPLTLLTALAVFGIGLFARRGMRFAPGIPLALVVLGLVFVATPSAIKDGTFVENRIALMMALVAFAGIDLRLPRRAGMIVGSIVAALIGLRAGHVGTVWAAHSNDLTDLRAAIAHVGPGSRVVVARGHGIAVTDDAPESRALPGIGWLDVHMPALLVIERRAFWPLLFADASQQPLVVKPPFDRLAHPLSDPVHVSMLVKEPPATVVQVLARYLPQWQSKFDHVLVVGATQPADLSGFAKPVHMGSFAQLYRVDRPKAE